MATICGAQCSNCCLRNTCPGCNEAHCFIARYINIGGMDLYQEFKNKLMQSINELSIPGMPKVTELYAMKGVLVNIPYRLPNGTEVKFLDDSEVYLGIQTKNELSDAENPRCFGVVGTADFILVAEYGENGKDPELVLFKQR